MENSTIYVVIDVETFSANAFTTKTQVADFVGCHRNHLTGISHNVTINDYIIIPAKVQKCNKGRKH